MTNNKPNDVRVVSVELLEEIVSNLSFCGARHKLTEILAQPADQQGEPVAVAWMRFDDDQRAIFTRSKRSKSSEPLYAHPTAYRHAQPATAKVVLPERRAVSEASREQAMCANTWNACLDATAKLNGAAKLDERLTEATAFVQKLCDAARGQQSFATGYLSDILDVLQGRATR